MAKFRGLSTCKGDCSGHRAGYRYARRGGATFSKWSSSFNNGMRIALGTFRPQPVAAMRARKK